MPGVLAIRIVVLADGPFHQKTGAAAADVIGRRRFDLLELSEGMVCDPAARRLSLGAFQPRAPSVLQPRERRKPASTTRPRSTAHSVGFDLSRYLPLPITFAYFQPTRLNRPANWIAGGRSFCRPRERLDQPTSRSSQSARRSANGHSGIPESRPSCRDATAAYPPAGRHHRGKRGARQCQESTGGSLGLYGTWHMSYGSVLFPWRSSASLKLVYALSLYTVNAHSYK